MRGLPVAIRCCNGQTMSLCAITFANILSYVTLSLLPSDVIQLDLYPAQAS